MVSFFSCLAAASATLLLAATPTCGADHSTFNAPSANITNAPNDNDPGADDDHGMLPIKEIAGVKVFNRHSARGFVRPKSLYVRFSHRGEVKGKSLPLSDSLESSWTNLPLLANEEGLNSTLKCEIRRRRFLLPDKTLYTAEIDLRDERKGEIWGDILDRTGRKTGALLHLEMFVSEWIHGSFDHQPSIPDKQDLYFRLLTKSLDTFSDIFFPGGIELLRKPIQLADRNLAKISLLGGLIEYPHTDEMFKVHPLVRWGQGLSNRLLPFTDSNHPIGNRVQARNELRTRDLGKFIVEPIEGRWVSPVSDQSMHRWFFSSNGMAHIKKLKEVDENGNLYVGDMSYLGTLIYRKKYENLGCKVFFDKEANITMIEDHDGSKYHPGDKFWEWAKQKARTNVFIINAMHHLIIYHLHWANVPGMAIRMFLGPTHSFREAMTTHFFRTHITCFQAKDFLIAEYGPLHRSLPFEYEGGYKEIYNKVVGDFRFIEYTKELEDAGLKDDKFHVGVTDGLILRTAIMNYVSNLIDELYPTEETLEEDAAMRDAYGYLVERMKGVPAEYNMQNAKLVWGEILFRVTGGHTNMGNVAISTLEPFFINFRMNKSDKGQLLGNRETLAIVSVIGGLTQPDVYPTFGDDWRHVLHEPTSPSYVTLKEELQPIAEEIDARNKERHFVNVDYHPDYVMISTFS